MSIPRPTRLAFVTATLVTLLSAAAFAEDLGTAKSKGLVGETNSGYVAAVEPSEKINALVTDINQQRKARYTAIAKENNISLNAVEARAGLKAIEKTPDGHYVDTGECWQKK